MQCFDGLSRPKGGFGGGCTLVGALEHRCKRSGMALTLSKRTAQTVAAFSVRCEIIGRAGVSTSLGIERLARLLEHASHRSLDAGRLLERHLGVVQLLINVSQRLFGFPVLALRGRDFDP